MLDAAQIHIALQLFIRGRSSKEKEIENMLLSVIGVALLIFIFHHFTKKHLDHNLSLYSKETLVAQA